MLEALQSFESECVRIVLRVLKVYAQALPVLCLDKFWSNFHSVGRSSWICSVVGASVLDVKSFEDRRHGGRSRRGQPFSLLDLITRGNWLAFEARF